MSKKPPQRVRRAIYLQPNEANDKDLPRQEEDDAFHSFTLEREVDAEVIIENEDYFKQLSLSFYQTHKKEEESAVEIIKASMKQLLNQYNQEQNKQISLNNHQKPNNYGKKRINDQNNFMIQNQPPKKSEFRITKAKKGENNLLIPELINDFGIINLMRGNENDPTLLRSNPALQIMLDQKKKQLQQLQNQGQFTKENLNQILQPQQPLSVQNNMNDYIKQSEKKKIQPVVGNKGFLISTGKQNQFEYDTPNPYNTDFQRSPKNQKSFQKQIQNNFDDAVNFECNEVLVGHKITQKNQKGKEEIDYKTRLIMNHMKEKEKLMTENMKQANNNYKNENNNNEFNPFRNSIRNQGSSPLRQQGEMVLQNSGIGLQNQLQKINQQQKEINRIEIRNSFKSPQGKQQGSPKNNAFNPTLNIQNKKNH